MGVVAGDGPVLGDGPGPTAAQGVQPGSAAHDDAHTRGHHCQGRRVHTLVLERTPPTASIQTYSAMTLPLWSRLMYFMSCRHRKSQYERERERERSWGTTAAAAAAAQGCEEQRTFSVLEMTVSRSACAIGHVSVMNSSSSGRGS